MTWISWTTKLVCTICVTVNTCCKHNSRCRSSMISITTLIVCIAVERIICHKSIGICVRGFHHILHISIGILIILVD